MTSLGFIILRHVKCNKTNQYWKISYACVRKFYPTNPILIIDDNSNYEHIDTEFDDNLTNTTIIQSEYPQRGELLPYLYYLTNKHCDVACIIHDSVFLNSKLRIEYTDNYVKLWDFTHDWNNRDIEMKLINALDNKEELIRIYDNSHLWRGCFGAMTLVNHDHLKKVNDRYNISNLTSIVHTRIDRMGLERVISIMLQSLLHYKDSIVVMHGKIHNYCRWGVTLNDINNVKHLPIIKVWTGR